MFTVTQEIITPKSAEYGDAESRKILASNITLREAIHMARETRTSKVDGILAVEPNCSPDYQNATWISIINGTEFETGAQEIRAIHFNQKLKPLTRQRLVKLLKDRLHEI